MVLAAAVATVAAACVPQPSEPTTTTTPSTTTTVAPVELTPVEDVQLAWAYSGYAQIGVFGPWSQTVTGDDVALAAANGEVSTGLAEHAARVFTEVHFDHGSGAIDPLTGEGTISWDGSWTLNAYAGQFGAPDETLSDPILDVQADGSGTLSVEAVVSAGLDSAGNPTPQTGPTRVDIVTFTSLAELTSTGMKVQPDFAGRAYVPGANESAWLSCDGSGGSWPAEWIQMVPSSLRPHYYTTSCGGLNAYKPPSTVHINWTTSDASVGVQPSVASTSVIAGTVVGPVGALGNPTPSIQWQVSHDGGANWSDVPGATGRTAIVLPEHSGALLRARVGNGSVVSDAIGPFTVQFVATSVNTFGFTEKIHGVGEQLRAFAIVTGAPAPAFEWQESTDGGSTWNAVVLDGRHHIESMYASETSNRRDLYIDNLTGADNGRLFRLYASNGFSAPAVSAPILLKVPTGPPVFTLAPAGGTWFEGEPANLVASLAMYPAPVSTEWQVSTDGGATWVPSTGVTTQTAQVDIVQNHVLPGSQVTNGALVRVVATNADGSTTSSAATLTTVATVGARQVVIVPDGPIDPTQATNVRLLGRGFSPPAEVTNSLAAFLTSSANWQPGQPLPSAANRIWYQAIASATNMRARGGVFAVNMTIPAGSLVQGGSYGFGVASSTAAQRWYDAWLPVTLVTP